MGELSRFVAKVSAGASLGPGVHRHPMHSLDEACSALASRLRERLPEIQAAIATRVYAISDPQDVADPAYLQGLNAALAAAIDYRIAVLEVGERRPPAVPAVLLAQARLDARDGVPLDTVLRRYFAGSGLFGDLVGQTLIPIMSQPNLAQRYRPTPT